MNRNVNKMSFPFHEKKKSKNTYGVVMYKIEKGEGKETPRNSHKNTTS